MHTVKLPFCKPKVASKCFLDNRSVIACRASACSRCFDDGLFRRVRAERARRTGACKAMI